MYKREKWTEDEDKKLISLAKKKYDNAELSKIFNRSVAAIAARKTKLGVTSYRYRWTYEDDKKLERLYKQGKSLAEIAEIMNTSYMSSYKRLERLNILSDSKLKMEAIEYSNKLNINTKLEAVERELYQGEKYKISYILGKTSASRETKQLIYKGSTKDLFIFEGENYLESFRKLDLINSDLKIEAIGKKRYKTA